jgi:hypothetical protein
MMGTYIEQSKKMFLQMQEQIESQTRSMFSGFQFPNYNLGAEGGKPETSPTPGSGSSTK